MPTPRDRARSAFTFLEVCGFERKAERDGPYESLGWVLEYESSEVTVRLEYDRHQFQVEFVAGDAHATYLTIDRDLFGRRSGFYGDVFGPDKLHAAIEQIAADIEAHYGSVLAGEPEVWGKIRALAKAPSAERRLP